MQLVGQHRREQSIERFYEMLLGIYLHVFLASFAIAGHNSPASHAGHSNDPDEGCCEGCSCVPNLFGSKKTAPAVSHDTHRPSTVQGDVQRASYCVAPWTCSIGHVTGKKYNHVCAGALLDVDDDNRIKGRVVITTASCAKELRKYKKKVRVRFQGQINAYEVRILENAGYVEKGPYGGPNLAVGLLLQSAVDRRALTVPKESEEQVPITETFGEIESQVYTTVVDLSLPETAKVANWMFLGDSNEPVVVERNANVYLYDHFTVSAGASNTFHIFKDTPALYVRMSADGAPEGHPLQAAGAPLYDRNTHFLLGVLSHTADSGDEYVNVYRYRDEIMAMVVELASQTGK